MLNSQKNQFPFGLGSAYNFFPSSENGYNTLGPSFYLDFSLGKSLENKFVAQLQYTKFQPYKDTIYEKDDSSPYSSKVYDLEGYYSQFSLGGAWQHNFRTDRKNTLFFELGGSMMWHDIELIGIILYDEPGSKPFYTGQGETYLTLNTSVALGLRQSFYDKFSVFEKIQGNYQFVKSAYETWNFVDLSEFRFHFLLHFSFGVTYNFGK